jgi:hypothetical protein
MAARISDSDVLGRDAYRSPHWPKLAEGLAFNVLDCRSKSLWPASICLFLEIQ